MPNLIDNLSSVSRSKCRQHTLSKNIANLAMVVWSLHNQDRPFKLQIMLCTWEVADNGMHLGRQLSAPKCTWPCQAVTAMICFLAACQLVGRSCPLTEGMCVCDVCDAYVWRGEFSAQFWFGATVRTATFCCSYEWHIPFLALFSFSSLLLWITLLTF